MGARTQRPTPNLLLLLYDRWETSIALELTPINGKQVYRDDEEADGGHSRALSHCAKGSSSADTDRWCRQRQRAACCWARIARDGARTHVTHYEAKVLNEEIKMNVELTQLKWMRVYARVDERKHPIRHVCRARLALCARAYILKFWGTLHTRVRRLYLRRTLYVRLCRVYLVAQNFTNFLPSTLSPLFGCTLLCHRRMPYKFILEI